MGNNFEDFNKEQPLVINIENDYLDLIPEDFINNPLQYFEDYGANIKSGEILYKEDGRVREDPTAVKKLPSWFNNGRVLNTVAKKVNPVKGMIGKSGDPFYEYSILKLAHSLNLPVAKPVAKIKQDKDYLIIMECLDGVSGSNNGLDYLKSLGLSDNDINDLKSQAETKMEEVKIMFEKAGFIRQWSLKDMIMKLDEKNTKVLSVTPTDWERTKVDGDKLDDYKSSLNNLVN